MTMGDHDFPNDHDQVREKPEKTQWLRLSCEDLVMIIVNF